MSYEFTIVELREAFALNGKLYRTLRVLDGWHFQEKIGGLICTKDKHSTFIPYAYLAPSTVVDLLPAKNLVQPAEGPQAAPGAPQESAATPSSQPNNVRAIKATQRPPKGKA